MRINKEKTKCTVISRGGKRANIKVRQDKIQQMELFKYLRSLINEDMSCTREIRARIDVYKRQPKTLTSKAMKISSVVSRLLLSDMSSSSSSICCLNHKSRASCTFLICGTSSLFSCLASSKHCLLYTSRCV